MTIRNPGSLNGQGRFDCCPASDCTTRTSPSTTRALEFDFPRIPTPAGLIFYLFIGIL